MYSKFTSLTNDYFTTYSVRKLLLLQMNKDNKATENPHSSFCVSPFLGSILHVDFQVKKKPPQSFRTSVSQFSLLRSASSDFLLCNNKGVALQRTAFPLLVCTLKLKHALLNSKLTKDLTNLILQLLPMGEVLSSLNLHKC